MFISFHYLFDFDFVVAKESSGSAANKLSFDWAEPILADCFDAPDWLDFKLSLRDFFPSDQLSSSSY